MHWWMNRPTAVVQAVGQLHTAIIQQECTYSGESALTRHLLNARRRSSRAGIQIAKAHPDSDKKIDAAYAAVLAWQARLAALAAGINGRPRGVARRIR
jgi:phage terminase large subunit-like protein